MEDRLKNLDPAVAGVVGVPSGGQHGQWQGGGVHVADGLVEQLRRQTTPLPVGVGGDIGDAAVGDGVGGISHFAVENLDVGDDFPVGG